MNKQIQENKKYLNEYKRELSNEIFNAHRNKEEIINFLTDLSMSKVYQNKKKRLKKISSINDITVFITEIRKNNNVNSYMSASKFVYYNNIIIKYSYNKCIIYI